jgi:hypothetical protein
MQLWNPGPRRLKELGPSTPGPLSLGVRLLLFRAMKAIRSLRDVVVTWPNELERERISKRMYKEFGWKNCVFIADGSLFPLGKRPQVEDWADYHGGK